MRLTTLVLPIPPMFSRILAYLGSCCGASKTSEKRRFDAQNLDLDEAAP
jgi:hypothetical protein